MKVYAGIDLHSNNNYLVLLNDEDKILYQKRLLNELPPILQALHPYREEIEGVVVESTYNWYWLVDALQESGYRVHLGNTAANKQYSGLKYTDDKTDAIWLARLLKLGLLEEGYIYPKEERGIRELLRSRMRLVRQQTMNLLSCQSLVTRYEGIKVKAEKIKDKREKEEVIKKINDKQVQIAASSQLKVLYCVQEEVKELEKRILVQIKENKEFNLLKGVPGIGPILASTILLETGDIKRFRKVGNYSSYCRCVESKRISNGKKKGENNAKNGNSYLSWAFIEAANYAIRYDEKINRYYQRKVSKTKRVIALKTIANKLARACFFMLRDGESFDVNKAFG